jgi:hypothetical protein
MPKRSRPEKGPDGWTPSQVVGHNITRARELRGLTQMQIAERMTRFTGSPWVQATVAQAEGSVRGERVRQFNANELVALARTFDLPIVWFLTPPDPGQGPERLVTPDHPRGIGWEHLVVALVGHADNFGPWTDRMAHWAGLAWGVDAPPGDPPLPAEPPAAAYLPQRTNAITHEDVALAAAIGLVRKQFGPKDGPLDPGFLDDLSATLYRLEKLVGTLRGYTARQLVAGQDIVEAAEDRARSQRPPGTSKRR